MPYIAHVLKRVKTDGMGGKQLSNTLVVVLPTTVFVRQWYDFVFWTWITHPNMENTTSHGNLTSTVRRYNTLLAGISLFTVACNIFLAITACLGSVLILIALRKVTSVNPPTNLLSQYLAITDLCVGLITQPFFVIALLTAVPKVYLYVVDTQNATRLILLRRLYPLRCNDLDIDRHKCGQTSRPVVGTKIQTCCNCKASSYS